MSARVIRGDFRPRCGSLAAETLDDGYCGDCADCDACRAQVRAITVRAAAFMLLDDVECEAAADRAIAHFDARAKSGDS